MSQRIVIGLSAVVAAVADGEARVLTVRTPGQPAALPFGPFDPEADRTFEIALRTFVSAQTGFNPGYVEQLYTFGDKGRDAPLAAVDGAQAARVISVGYLGLTARADTVAQAGATWSAITGFFPWEDWRDGRPAALAGIEAALRHWAGASAARLSRVRLLFALDEAPWNDERVLERYELLYEAGLAQEAARDRGETPDPAIALLGPALGEPMISDHRRILATALSRLRGKLRYRPVIFEMMPDAFTLSALQKAVELVAGVPLHKQNFRRALERSGLVEGLGRLDQDTGGRPAELFRFRRESLASRSAPGLSLPLLRD